MSEAPEAPVTFGLHDLGYQADGRHDLYLELLAPNGQVVQSLKLPAPVNKDSSAPFAVQVVLAHEDGCSRVLQIAAIKPY